MDYRAKDYGSKYFQKLISLRSLMILFFSFISLEALGAEIKITPLQVTATGLAPGSKYEFATDGDSKTYWVAPSFAPQSIDLDFGRPIAIGKIRLLTTQYPAGQTSHKIYIGNDINQLRLVKSFNGITADNQWLQHIGDGENGDRMGRARYLRVTTTSSPSWIGWREIEVYQGIQYLGYFASDWEGHFTGDPAKETKAVGANLTWIQSAKPSFIRTRLAAAKAEGSKSILILSPQMFQADAGYKNLRLLPIDTIRKNLDAIAQILAEYPGVAIAAYPYDEPYYNADRSGVKIETMKKNLDTAARLIREKLPGLLVGTIITVEPIEMNLDKSYYAMFDLLGFDRYSKWTDCVGCFQDWITALRGKLSRTSQRMIAAPWAFRWNNSGIGVVQQGELIDNINDWHKEFINDGRYVNVAPFLWNSVDLDNSKVIDTGAKDLKLVRERIHQMSRSLLKDEKRLFPAKVVASRTYGATLPFMASDRDNSSSWISDAFGTTAAPQWIEFDFGGRTRINRIDLLGL